MCRACERGATTGCTQLGLMHVRGAGEPRNVERAATRLQKGCVGGDVAGCGELARLYAAGEGVNQDCTRAATLFKQSCD